MTLDQQEPLTGTSVGSNGLLSNEADKQPIVPLGPDGKPLDPTKKSIESQPLSSLPPTESTT